MNDTHDQHSLARKLANTKSAPGVKYIVETDDIPENDEILTTLTAVVDGEREACRHLPIDYKKTQREVREIVTETIEELNEEVKS